MRSRIASELIAQTKEEFLSIDRSSRVSEHFLVAINSPATLIPENTLNNSSSGTHTGEDTEVIFEPKIDFSGKFPEQDASTFVSFF